MCKRIRNYLLELICKGFLYHQAILFIEKIKRISKNIVLDLNSDHQFHSR